MRDYGNMPWCGELSLSAVKEFCLYLQLDWF